jgi:SAM-dependent methyltransferase
MNLHDIVRRQDRMLEVADGTIEATMLKLPSGTQRAVRLSADARVHLRDAHSATCLQDTPRAPGWVVHMQPGSQLQVWLESAGNAPCLLANIAPKMPQAVTPKPLGLRDRLAAHMPGKAPSSAPVAGPLQPVPLAVHFDWPLRMPPAYDLVLACGDAEVALAIGPLLDMRHQMLPVLLGKGVEVGPGGNPALESDDSRTVRYVEKMSARDWARTYPKVTLDDAVLARWSEYAIAPAEGLDGFEPGSLDFIFSSHVLEHLVNPLQVLQNWWRCLAPGGVIAAVVPDARYSFDLRQPITSTDALLSQHRAGGHERTAAMYAQWCRHTAPEVDPARLRERDYAIHVNYFSPASACAMLEVFRGMVADPGGVRIGQFLNGREFAFAVCKPS